MANAQLLLCTVIVKSPFKLRVYFNAVFNLTINPNTE